LSHLARWLARHLWWGMLWLMRRPWMSSLQRRSLLLFPPASRERTWKSMVRQNRFARRYGLKILTVAVNVLLASIIITLSFLLALNLVDQGILTVPDAVRERFPQ
jgi:hypothetical protein